MHNKKFTFSIGDCEIINCQLITKRQISYVFALIGKTNSTLNDGIT